MLTHYDILGCWGTNQPVAEDAADPPSENLDCVFGTADGDGKWAVSNCVTNIAGAPAGAGAGGIDFGNTPAKFGSICEKEDAPTTAAPPTTAGPPETSDSTCLKSGITFLIGMLFFCYQ